MPYVHAFPMHTYSIFNILVIFEMCWDFSDCHSLSLSFLVTLAMSMASSSNPTPSSIWFRDKDARKDFLENFSRRGVHSERRVILADFADTDLPNVIYSRGWESLCDVLVTCPFVLIQEFYSNMHGLDSSVPLFHTCVQGTRNVVTPQLVLNVLHVPRVKHLDYPRCERLRTMSKDEMIFAFYECLSNWGYR